MAPDASEQLLEIVHERFRALSVAHVQAHSALRIEDKTGGRVIQGVTPRCLAVDLFEEDFEALRDLASRRQVAVQGEKPGVERLHIALKQFGRVAGGIQGHKNHL